MRHTDIIVSSDTFGVCESSPISVFCPLQLAIRESLCASVTFF